MSQGRIVYRFKDPQQALASLEQPTLASEQISTSKSATSSRK